MEAKKVEQMSAKEEKLLIADELLRLRSQCESQAKQQTLYSRRDPEWLEWNDAQKARVKAEAHYNSLPASPAARKAQALKEWLIVSLHTVQPPDRVRRLALLPCSCAHSPRLLVRRSASRAASASA